MGDWFWLTVYAGMTASSLLMYQALGKRDAEIERLEDVLHEKIMKLAKMHVLVDDSSDEIARLVAEVDRLKAELAEVKKENV